MSGEAKTNRLIHEKSPYLLQHAQNPVDWFPWGEEAFAAAKGEDKPIFLSIGYATCHWCHVMEKETFTNGAIAHLMNETFINIKVDREEHPEVDSLYMEFAQTLMSSSGGWPLNLVLTPELKPFFAITYLPPKADKGLIGMEEFVKQIHALWRSEERSLLAAQAEKIVTLFKEKGDREALYLPTEQDLRVAVQTLLDLADPIFGGVKGEPKFPLGYQADFLLQYGKMHDDGRCLFYVELTLHMMARGGIYDHLGGGFSRYCIDERWHIPHFEKMLYDNAILAKVYLEAYKYTKKSFFGQVCRHTLDYLLREMQEGGFHSAQDADSEGEEGKFYTWKIEEIIEALGQGDGELFCRYFGVTNEGNFGGKNVLHIPFDPKQFSEIVGVDEEKLGEIIYRLKEKLFQRRITRKAPLKDDKVITSWNGLAIDVLARAGFSFDESNYLEAAKKTADWIKTNLWTGNALLRRFRDGDSRFAAGLDDYAFLIRSLLTLFEVGGGIGYLEWAIELVDLAEKELKVEGGPFYQSREDKHLLIRKCEFYDGAEPSGNAVHCENLLRLHQLTQENRFLSQAEDILKGAAHFIESFSPGACYHLIALQRYLNSRAPLIVIALDQSRNHERVLRRALGAHFCPHSFIVWKGEGDALLDKKIPSIATYIPIEGKTTLYICSATSCQAPLNEIDQMLEAIERL